MPAQVRTKYESDNGAIYLMKLSPNYALAAGTSPAGAINREITVKVSRSRREIGLSPRHAVLGRTVGTAPNTFVKYTKLPLRSIADFTSATYAKGQPISVGSTTWEVYGKVAEDFN
jgi:hypothetical protein